MYVRVGGSAVDDGFGPAEDEDAERPEVGPALPWRDSLGGGVAGVRERVRAARALLDRPLTSYYLILGITTLLLCLGLMMVLSTASVIDLSQGESPYHDFEWQVVGIVGRPADHVADGALVAAGVPGDGLPAAGGVRHRPRADADPGRRGEAQRRGPLDRDRPDYVPAVRAGQAGARGLGRGPARPQGEAGHAGRLAAPAGPADAGRGRARHAGDGGRRPRHHLHPADHRAGAALDRRNTDASVHRPAHPDGAGAGAADRGQGLRVRPDHRFPEPVQQHQPDDGRTSSPSRGSTRSDRAACSASASARARSSGAGCPRTRATSSSRSSARNLALSARSA